ncbi:hypothetical protein ACQEU6_13600 [Spirillospora sp. CA-108201]
MFGGRRETCARLLGLVLRRSPLPEDDRGRFRDLGVLAARQAIPLPVPSDAWDLALAAAARTCWTAALEEASRVLTIAKAIPDAEDRPYRADELLVELAILGQPAIRGRLAAVLSPLDAGTDLRRTLEVLLACNLDRERAARELWIHRRTRGPHLGPPDPPGTRRPPRENPPPRLREPSPG